jgi:hypothetical protein
MATRRRTTEVGMRSRRLRSAGARAADWMVPLQRGFTKAFSAISDANITTLLAAGLLFFLASGAVRRPLRHAHGTAPSHPDRFPDH